MKCVQCECVDRQQFYKSNKSRCKQCTIDKVKRRYDGLSEEAKTEYRNRSSRWQDENIFQYRYLQARERAMAANLPCTIDKQHLEQLFEMQNGRCFYSGESMTRQRNGGMSICVDRKDNTLGYVPENVVLCCAQINTMKSGLTTKEFSQIIERIFHTFVKHNETSTTN